MMTASGRATKITATNLAAIISETILIIMIAETVMVSTKGGISAFVKFPANQTAGTGRIAVVFIQVLLSAYI